jgi:hypothetical protein
LLYHRTVPKINVTSTPDLNRKLDNQSGAAGLRPTPGSAVKRAESLRTVSNQSGPSSLTAGGGDAASRLKRNPSFTTRKRSTSLRKVGTKGLETTADLPPVEMSGVLDRKHEQQSGGKRAAIRSWKSYYTGRLFDDNFCYGSADCTLS